jgi:tetratricopeptide (TPR) repeat protein
MHRVFATMMILILSAPAAAEDVIEYFGADGKLATARGVIDKESPTEVGIKVGAESRTISVPQIDSVKYDSQPPQLVTIRGLERSERLEEAYSQYEGIFGSLPANEFLQTAVAFDMLRTACKMAIADPQQSDRAVQMYSSSSAKFGKSRHFYPMQELIGQVHLAKGDMDAAAKAFASLKEVNWPGYREKGLVYEGLARLRAGKLDEAKASFDQVIQSPNADRESTQQKTVAKVYLGQVMVEKGDASQAESVLRESLSAIPTENSFAKALGHNALGDAILANKKPKEAALDGYLWVLVVYNQNPDQLARAMYHLATIFPQIGFPERGEQLAADLKARFPNSEWAKKLDQ